MIKNFTRLRGQVVWLTGASTGIGKALALRLAELGNHIIISARNEVALEELAQCKPEAFSVLPLDVTDKEAVVSCVNHIEETYGRVDLLIANAGTCEYVDVQSMEVDLFKRVMDTNFFGVVNVVSAALPLLRKSTQGHIAVMSSSSTYLALPRAEAYGASKAALNYFSESLRVDLASENIFVTLISPGFVETPLTDQNDFPMPAMVKVERAAEEIATGLENQILEIHFPKRFTLTLKAIACLPKRLQFGLAKKLSRNELAAN